MKKLKRLKKRLFFRTSPSRFAYLTAALFLMAAFSVTMLNPRAGYGQALVNNRKLTLSSSAHGNVSLDAGGTDVCAITTFANPQGGCGAKAKHTVNFTLATSTTNTGSIIIMYCTSPIFSTTCTTPEGMTVTFLDTVTVTGLNVTSPYSLDLTTSNSSLNAIAAVDNNGQCNDDPSNAETGDRHNCVALKRGTAQADNGNPAATIAYGGTPTDYVVNPIPSGNPNLTFYARILVFSDTGYTNLVDYGGLAASVNRQIDITAKVQEVLRFSIGRTAGHAKVSDAACTPYNDDGAIAIGDANGVLDSNQAYDNHSFFRINTNTVQGTVIQYSGDTLRSGSNDINEIGGTAAFSAPGTEQFGLGINNAHTDSELDEVVPQAPYDDADGTLSPAVARFAFIAASRTAPATIATSPAGIVCATGAVRYVANISTSTPAGIYRTRITYIAIGTY